MTYLLQPHRCEDEEQLDEDGSEGQNAADKDAKNRVHVPSLLRDLPRYFICAHRVLQYTRG